MDEYPFVTVEGIDYTGKTTAIRKAVNSLDSWIMTSEPSSWVKHNTDGLQDPVTKALLMCADRYEHNNEIQLWQEQHPVVCDRYMHSTLAYQGEARDKKWFYSLVADTALPMDATIYVQSPVDVVKRRGAEEDADYLHEVKDRYERLLGVSEGESLLDDVYVIDGTQNKSVVAEEMTDTLQQIYTQ